MSSEHLRQLPSVNDLLLAVPDLVDLEGHQRVVEALRQTLDAARAAIRGGAGAPTDAEIIRDAHELLAPVSGSGYSAVLNATGVIIHTNLGRAVLSESARRAMNEVASNYSALEYDLRIGARGARGRELETLLCEVTGAESALVVNNCASATILMLTALVRGKGVIISRGQLVEIGGGFRIPEILEQSGARLVEVGTTNRTRRHDYEQALQDTEGVGALLRVHPSNFRVIGFSEDVSITDMVDVAADRASRDAGGERQKPGIVVLDDVGSGALLDTGQFGLKHEPMPQESVSAGASVVTFSGDKLVGGPQAGIMVGRGVLIEQCRKHPLARAFRADKFTLAALEATIRHYVRQEAVSEIPVWRMIARPYGEVRSRAEHCVRRWASWIEGHALRAEVIEGESTIGGGSLPGETLATALIALGCDRPDDLLQSLRTAPTPIIARIQGKQVLLDLRTVLNDEMLTSSLCAV